ncbi:F-box/FBD/LRR-repeat protein At1g13570-like isoform X2 [Phoenix dactylifera]|uniref:F-box/FBD/LRR-repeat protein At1g13570-like isoform X2 n=1 Tax=Phoenix dactylifera TaxID=42345 RepID=A0A8B7D321_PHODC|nr:F-box/FBD/LRR-repeat protein At1g13570-like isoform X2 [Phoenix dactylifera]
MAGRTMPDPGGADRLSSLPDAILSSILSLLTVREAVRTSVLSRRWRHVWCQTSDLFLDAPNLFPPDLCIPDSELYNLFRGERDRLILHLSCRFLSAAGALLAHHQAHKLGTFRLHFPLGRGQSQLLDSWLEHAIGREVEILDLNFNKGRPIIRLDFARPYNFPFRLLLSSPSGANCLKRLFLEFSIWNPPLEEFEGFASLQVLELRRVNITERHVKDLLASCPVLERLVLAKCGDFVDLVVSSDSLKYFFLEEWQSLKSVELSGANLSTFEYRGRQVWFSFEKVPRLERLFLFKDSVRLVDYALNRLPIDAPQIKTLTMCVSSPREVGFYWKMAFHSNYMSHNRDVRRYKKVKVLHEGPHHHLENVELSGFTGSNFQLDIAKYILNIAVNLKLMMIDPRPRQYISDGKLMDVEGLYEGNIADNWTKKIRTLVHQQLSGEGFRSIFKLWSSVSLSHQSDVANMLK